MFITLQPIRAVCDVYTSYTYKKSLLGVQLLIVLAAMLPAQALVQSPL